MPESDAKDAANPRLTDKFASSTTLWHVLRKFEGGVAGGADIRNFTARGVPSKSTGSSGAGRIYYEQPVVQIMNRELASFMDLQKSLAQLGFNTGSALLRLSFRPTETPLEDAMAQIKQYFNSIEGEAPVTASSQPQSTTLSAEKSSAATGIQPEWTEDDTADGTSQSPKEDPVASSPEPPTTTAATGRPVSVYRPPSSSTPSAALMSHNDADYTPTVEHAQVHQRLLQQNTRNVRLKTEAQLVAQAEEEAAKLAAVKEVDIKIRFPDQSVVQTLFGQSDSSANLYTFVRDCLEDHWRSEVFTLRIPGVRGRTRSFQMTPARC